MSYSHAQDTGKLTDQQNAGQSQSQNDDRMTVLNMQVTQVCQSNCKIKGTQLLEYRSNFLSSRQRAITCMYFAKVHKVDF